MSARLLQQLYGPWDQIDADFRKWLDARHNSFHYVEWGWEQSSNTLWSYGFAGGGKLSETDVLLPPGQKPAFDPLRLDYPAAALSPLVGPVARGTEEPSVGCLIDFSANPRHGRAGLGLGVVHGNGLLRFAADQLFTDKEATKKGVAVSLFELGKVTGEGRRSEDVVNGDRVATSVDATIGLNLKDSAALLNEDFVVEWEGWLRIPKAGEQHLGIDSDHGAWLWIDDRLVVDRAGQPEKRYVSNRVKLDEGLHRLRLRYYQKEGPKTLTVGFAPEVLPGTLRLLIVNGTQLVLDGSEVGLERKEAALPEDLLKAMAAGGERIGLNAKIGNKALQVTLRAQAKGAEQPVSFEASLALTAEVRTRLLTQPLAHAGPRRLSRFDAVLRRGPATGAGPVGGGAGESLAQSRRSTAVRPDESGVAAGHEHAGLAGKVACEAARCGGQGWCDAEGSAGELPENLAARATTSADVERRRM